MTRSVTVNDQKFLIRPVEECDKTSILTIYQQGMDTGISTFEVNAPSWEVWRGKFVSGSQYVAETQSGQVVGWVALSAVSSRCVYEGVCETTIYIDPAWAGFGIGKRLLKRAMAWANDNRVWTLQANIFPQNHASLHLHESLGFRIVGFRERIAQRHGSWYDNVLLEYRSQTIF